jgi:hypothetical protein
MVRESKPMSSGKTRCNPSTPLREKLTRRYGLPARLSSGPPFAPAPKNWLNGTDTKEYV